MYIVYMYMYIYIYVYIYIYIYIVLTARNGRADGALEVWSAKLQRDSYSLDT